MTVTDTMENDASIKGTTEEDDGKDTNVSSDTDTVVQRKKRKANLSTRTAICSSPRKNDNLKKKYKV